MMTPLALLVTAVVAGSGAASEVRGIDRSCDAARDLDDAHKQKARILGDVSEAALPEANEGGGTWRAFKSADDLKAYAEKDGAPNTQARLWNAPDGTTIAAMYFTSDSGDWSDDVTYCFRADGSLARIAAILINYAADAHGWREIHYGPDGAVLAKRAQSVDERTKKKVAKEHTGNVVPIYPTVASLPFLQGARGPTTPATTTPATTTPATTKPATTKPATTGSTPAPAPEGELDPGLVARFVKARLPEIKGCYESELAKKAALSGKVTMHWTIKVDGAVGGVGITEDTLGAPTVASCLGARVAAWRFPPPAGGTVDVTFPFVFQMAGTPGLAKPRP